MAVDSDKRIAVSPAEAAVMLGMSTKTIYGLLSSGQVPARRLGGRWFISKEALGQFLKG